MNFLAVTENLKDVLSEEVGGRIVYDKDVANALGISKDNFAHLKKRGSIPYEAVACFCAKRSISINWILFNQLPKSLEKNTEKYARIKYFKDIHSSAGGGAYNDEENYCYINIKDALLDHCSSHENFHVINVIGDSMEPTLKDKERILCDRGKTTIEKEGIYIINTANSGLLVKRVKKVEDAIHIISDNKEYPKEVISNSEDISVLAKVVGKVEVS